MILSLENISKSFAGVQALSNVSLDVREGEVHALLGENGAGKSTLIKTIAGMHQPDSGQIKVGGIPVCFSSPHDALASGVAVVHQELLLFPDMTVMENIFIGHAPRTAYGALDWPRMRERAKALLEQLDSHDLDVDSKVGSLSVANRQRVEIAKALSQDARFLILDEPTAALTDADARRLLRIVDQLRARGVATIYISHRLPEIFAIADRVTVLRDGANVGTYPIGEVTESELVKMMVGRPIDQLFPKEHVPIGRPVLEARNLCHRNIVKDVSFTLHAGEILGIAGLIGAGRTETALTLFGITPATSGDIILDGRPVVIPDPRKARDLGIAYVPEDRAHQGLVRRQSIRSNLCLAVLDRIAPLTVINKRAERALADELFLRFGVRARGIAQPVGTLSGGNQQKVVLGKWIATKPRVLILDEPTRGIDVGAKAEIYNLMSALTREGLAIIMISSELPEILGMADRVLVMRAGRIVATFDRSGANPDTVGAAMADLGSDQPAAGVA